MSKKAMLIIMDGWGHGQVPASDAIANANVPFVKSLYDKYPNTELITCGTAVGLPEGQMGNSEVGHLNLGAGAVVKQDLTRIDEAVRDGSLASNEVLREAFTGAPRAHIIGLVSDGGVHSGWAHLEALIGVASELADEVVVHAFTDGRDTSPHGGEQYLTQVQEWC